MFNWQGQIMISVMQGFYAVLVDRAASWLFDDRILNPINNKLYQNAGHGAFQMAAV